MNCLAAWPCADTITLRTNPVDEVRAVQAEAEKKLQPKIDEDERGWLECAAGIDETNPELREEIKLTTKNTTGAKKKPETSS